VKTLADKAKEIEAKFDEGQEIFHRKSVEILLARIQSLEIAAQHQNAGNGANCPACGEALECSTSKCRYYGQIPPRHQ